MIDTQYIDAVQIVAQALENGQPYTEQATAAAELLAQRLAEVQRLGGPFAKVQLSGAVKKMLSHSLAMV